MQPEHSEKIPRTKTKSLFALVFVLNLLAIAGVAFLFIMIRDKNEHASIVNNDLERALTEKSDMQSLQKEVSAIEADSKTLNSFLVGKDNVVAFLESVDALGKTTGCETKVKTVEEIKDPKVSKIHLVVSANCPWSSLHTFFSALLSIPYKIELKNASLVASLETESVQAKAKRAWIGTFDFTVLEAE
ncbi:MAG: hypothetical protein PHS53_01875 [Candidatus Pacebacteria bacterium]|nr:hypothetical protein [Candidatus Paceibacterota bacterium]MDD5356876.1 hypothetical protein [Candidatus Paceibacterota bacterium]